MPIRDNVAINPDPAGITTAMSDTTPKLPLPSGVEPLIKAIQGGDREVFVIALAALAASWLHLGGYHERMLPTPAQAAGNAWGSAALSLIEPDPIQWTPRSAMSVIHGRPVRALATNREPAVGG